MAKQKKVKQINYPKIINTAVSSLGRSYDDSIEVFSIYSFCLSDYYDLKRHIKTIDVYIDSIKTTLICFFNRDMECEKSILVLYADSDVENLIKYLNAKYTYDYMNSRWAISSDAYVKTLKTTDTTVFGFYQLTKEEK